LEENIYKALVTSMEIAILAELSFTLYTDVYGLMNLVGHLFKVASLIFIFIYRSVVKAGLKNPYEFIFRELKKSSRTDQLTGLYNRAGFYESVGQFAQESLQRNSSVGILLMDPTTSK
jgi:GGDEF domain-containing protein